MVLAAFGVVGCWVSFYNAFWGQKAVFQLPSPAAPRWILSTKHCGCWIRCPGVLRTGSSSSMTGRRLCSGSTSAPWSPSWRRCAGAPMAAQMCPHVLQGGGLHCPFTCVIAACNLLQGIAREQRVKALGQKSLEDFEPNDLNYESRLQEDAFLNSGISFNLLTELGESAAGLGRSCCTKGSSWVPGFGLGVRLTP